MKVAIVHDELMRRGGAEQVVLTMLKAFPQADVYTLAYDPNGTYPEFKRFKVKTSWFQPLARSVNMMQALFFPFGIWAMKSLKVTGYDVVLISNTHCGKYVDIDSRSKVIMYVHTPFRLAWNPESYSQYNSATGLKKYLFEILIRYLKKVDAEGAKNGDYFIGNSKETSDKIKSAYNIKDVEVIHPDVKSRQFYISDKPKEYYLMVCRLEYYKKVDLAIEVFNNLGFKLIIVGNGTKAEQLKALAKDNIEFKTGLSNTELAEMYANCKALIFPQHEDYGITPLEANASGRPVIGYGAGGIVSTMLPYRVGGDSKKATAVFFEEQTVESLTNAIAKFERLEFDPIFIKNHAAKFDEEVFITNIQQFVKEKHEDRLVPGD
jgi:glycosyltransferase involved in cell wall biosynthesis